MIKRLICWLWGHSFMRKAYTGETMISDNGFGQPITHALYRVKRQKFCKRCGAEWREDNQ